MFNHDLRSFSLNLLYLIFSILCSAIGNLDHCLNQDCDTMPIRLKGASDGKTKKIHPSV